MTRTKHASKPQNFDALVDAAIRKDRDAWREAKDQYRQQVAEAGEDW